MMSADELYDRALEVLTRKMNGSIVIEEEYWTAKDMMQGVFIAIRFERENSYKDLPQGTIHRRDDDDS